MSEIGKDWRSVEEASNKSNANIHSVFVGIAGSHIKSYQVRGMRTRRASR